MRKLTCTKCSKTFKALDRELPMKAALGGTSEPICYTCALKRITGGRAPEEGDFNSARIISGEMTEQDLKYLLEDLRAVEEGRSIREYYDDDDDEYIDFCHSCGYEVIYCICDDLEDLKDM